MSKITAEVIADSICKGRRITTMLLKYPRIIHSEMCRHRVFSRNTASSRAIPAQKMIEAVMNDPFIPIAWQKQHTGMQGTKYITDPAQIEKEVKFWLEDRTYAVGRALSRIERGVTKQLVNRPLEPWMWTVEIVTATEWENFFHLRCPQYEFNAPYILANKFFRSRRDVIRVLEQNEYENTWGAARSMSDLEWLQFNRGQAEIHMMAIAEAMWDARNESIPKVLQPGDWHIPFGDMISIDDPVFAAHMNNAEGLFTDRLFGTKLKIATARCARTSYTVVGEAKHKQCSHCGGTGVILKYDGDGGTVECTKCNGSGAITNTPDYQKDIELHDRLVASGHWSPFEHCARAMTDEEYETHVSGTIPSLIKSGSMKGLTGIPPETMGWCKNFHGWIPYRAMFPNENKTA